MCRGNLPCLVNPSGDMYGKRVEVYLRKFRRPERRFDSLEALREQILQDAARTRDYFKRSEGGTL